MEFTKEQLEKLEKGAELLGEIFLSDVKLQAGTGVNRETGEEFPLCRITILNVAGEEKVLSFVGYDEFEEFMRDNFDSFLNIAILGRIINSVEQKDDSVRE